jgi:DNA-binding IclR family transcriptional regulator
MMDRLPEETRIRLGRLTAHHTAVIQAAMANQPEETLVALVYQLVLKVFSRDYVETPVKIASSNKSF